MTALDRESGQRYELRTRRVANCAGPWSRELSKTLDREVVELFRPALAFNLLLDREPVSDVALAVSPPHQSRSYFLVPWRNRLMAGTCHAALGTHSGKLGPDDPPVRAFLADLAAAAPALELERAAILRVLQGRLPASAPGAATPAARPVIHRHADRGGPQGLVSVSGVKYTTARATAEAVLHALDGGGLPAIGDQRRPEPARWPSRTELERADADDGRLAGRLRRLAAAESVVRVDDLLLRRTDLGLDPADGERLARKVAGLLALGQAGGAAP